MKKLIYHHKINLLKIITIFLLINFCFITLGFSKTEHFPIFPSINKNYEFWKSIYSFYPSNKGVLHDTNDVTVIYEVVDLVDQRKRGARKLNNRRIKYAKKKYKKILRQLAKGKQPTTKEEKRIALLFGKNPNKGLYYKASKNIRCQVGQKDRFKNGIIRSGAYTDKISEIFKKKGLPEDLMHIPHVESSFNPKAYSKMGAAGMWQFTRATGRRYLKVNYVIDERRDPIKSSYAAAKLLKRNYELLKSWPLAITAYNHGAAGMLRAKKAKGNYENIFNEYKRNRFKFASKNFYSEFLAARHVAKNYKKYFKSITLHEPVKYYSLKLDGYAYLQDILDHLNVNLKTFKRLNPSLKKPAYIGQKFIPKYHTVNLPISHKVYNSLPKKIYKNFQKKSRFYKVERGDTASRIARIHNVSLHDLLLANNLSGRATIYPNQNLRIPLAGERITKPKKQTLIAKVLKQKAEKIIPIIKTDKMIPSNIKDQLLSILHEATGDDKIERLNNELKINSNIVTGEFNIIKTFVKKGKKYGVISVQPDETIGHYAHWLNTSATKIRSLNKRRKSIRLYQKFIIALDKITKDKFEEKRFEYHKEIEDDFFAAYRIENIQLYQIQKNDNIWNLCEDEFDVPLWLFIKYNPKVNINKLKLYQNVLVPIVEEKIE